MNNAQQHRPPLPINASKLLFFLKKKIKILKQTKIYATLPVGKSVAPGAGGALLKIKCLRLLANCRWCFYHSFLNDNHYKIRAHTPWRAP